jgi:hypothetical protein
MELGPLDMSKDQQESHAHPTISQDWTIDSHHNEAQLFVLRDSNNQPNARHNLTASSHPHHEQMQFREHREPSDSGVLNLDDLLGPPSDKTSKNGMSTRSGERVRRPVYSATISDAESWDEKNVHHYANDGPNHSSYYTQNDQSVDGSQRNNTPRSPDLRRSHPDNIHDPRDSEGPSLHGTDVDTKIEELKAQISSLERLRNPQAWQYQLLHRIRRRKERRHDTDIREFPVDEIFSVGPEKRDNEDDIRYFLDRPRLSLERDSLEGTLPISNIGAYLERQPNVSFVVFRDYKLTEKDAFSHVSIGSDAILPGDRTYVQPCFESISIIAKDLRLVVADFIRAGYPMSEYDAGLLSQEELPAPYLFVYHHRQKLENFRESLPEDPREQWDLLMKYISQAFFDEYKHADYVLSQGLVTHRYVKYLVKPGDILLSTENGSVLAHEAESGPDNPHSAGDPGHRNGSRSYKELPRYFAFDVSGQEKGLSLEWDIRATHWDFSTSFVRYDTSLKLLLSAPPDTKVPISSLNVYPLRFADRETVESLRRRGEIFWTCRNRRYVEYEDNGMMKSSQVSQFPFF